MEYVASYLHIVKIIVAKCESIASHIFEKAFLEMNKRTAKHFLFLGHEMAGQARTTDKRTSAEC